MTDDYSYDDESGEESGDGEHDLTTEAYLDEADGYKIEHSKNQNSSEFNNEPSSNDEDLN